MDLSKVKELVEPFLAEKEETLYDVSFVNEAGMRILRVLVDKKGGITVDDLAEVNEYLSEKLDAIDSSEQEYMLEVSSPGAECPLRNEEEISDHVGSYVHITTNDKQYEGTLISFQDGVIVVRVNLKGRFKNFDVPYGDVQKIRLAIKF